jgi:hypothetical protein
MGGSLNGRARNLERVRLSVEHKMIHTIILNLPNIVLHHCQLNSPCETPKK